MAVWEIKKNVYSSISRDFLSNSNFDFAGSQPGSLSPEVDSTSSGFTVQRGRAVPTLTSVHQSASADQKSDKEQFNKDTKSDELGEEGDGNVFQQVSLKKTHSRQLGISFPRV